MVNTSLFTGLAGLRSHQTQIDVIGANLANVSTPGYRGSRMSFTDILSFTLRPGSGPNGNFGGTNPMQIGLGASVGSIDVNTNQGTFQDTGRPLDVAMQGKGFFTMTNGAQTFYTRVGTLGVDAARLLVDSRTGYRVVAADGSNITIPESDLLPAQLTSSVTFTGALPAEVSGPLEEIVESSVPVQQGSAATKTSTASGTIDMSGRLGESMLIAVNGQAQQRVTFTTSDFAVDTAATLAEIVAAINTPALAGATASIDGSGNLQIETQALGTSATIKLDDASDSSGLLALIGFNTTLVAGANETTTDNTDLGFLTTRVTQYTNGDQIEVRGTNVDGSPFSGTFIYGTTGTTIGELTGYIEGLIANDGTPTATVAFDTATGNIKLTARDKGPAQLSLSVRDLGGTTKNSWPSFTLTQDGTGPDTTTAAIDVIDSQGVTHPVSFTFTRSTTADNIWNLSASLPTGSGDTVTPQTIQGITFNDDGSIATGSVQPLVFSFSGIGTQQSVTLNLGSQGQFNGVAMLGNQATVAATDQDGFGAGTLLNIAIDQSGNLQGFYTNGQSRTLDQLRISVFSNEAGLLRTGDTMFVQSPNSDDAIATVAGSAGAGRIRAGSLENSNVDIAEEFVALIEAQRGFQANSRIITTTDEILAELVNIVR